ncbi:hypothetical protein [Desulfocurvus sp. DL9XJH121]
MKSKLFGEFDPSSETNKQFISDLKTIFDLDQRQRHAIANALPGLVSIRTEKEMEKRIEDIQSETGTTRLLIGHIFDIAGFFLRQMLDDRLKDEPHTDWSSDLIELGLLEQDQEAIFLAFLQELKERSVPELSQAKKERTYEAGVLPVLRSCGTTVELRAVFDKPYRWGTPLDKYNPILETVIPVISVRITLDSGETSDIGFQITPEVADLLINQLGAAKLDADLLLQKITIPESKQA